MNILVCVKQTPDIEKIKLDGKTNEMRLDGVPLIVNPYDTYALETAVRLKEACPESRVYTLTMGPDKARDALKSCLSVGADKAYLLRNDGMTEADTLTTAAALSLAAREIEAREGLRFDLILCGKQAADGDTAQVGPQLAAYLDLPQLTSAMELTVEDGRASVRRPAEDGMEVVSALMPALVTMSQTPYEPRYASVKTKLAAARAVIPELTPDELGPAPVSPARVVRSYVPARKQGGIRISEDSGEASAAKLLALLRGAGVI